MIQFNMEGHLIRRLHQLSGQVFQRHTEEAGFELTPVQFSALHTLRANPGVEQAQLAALIAYDRATLGSVLDRLEKKGYIQRAVSPTDRRAREVRLTDAGLALVEAATPVVEALQAEIAQGLDDKERGLLVNLMRKVVNAHEQNK